MNSCALQRSQFCPQIAELIQVGPLRRHRGDILPGHGGQLAGCCPDLVRKVFGGFSDREHLAGRCRFAVPKGRPKYFFAEHKMIR